VGIFQNLPKIEQVEQITATSCYFYTERFLFLQLLHHTINNCDLIDEAIEKTELTERKKNLVFLDYPPQKIIRFCASERSFLAPDYDR